MKSPRLKAERLVKSFRRRRILNGISLGLDCGEVVGLLGPNGAGKTTTFRILTGLITPDEGSVILDGEDVTAMPFYARARLGLGYLPQESSVFRGLTVEKNLLSVLECKLDDRRKRNEVCRRLIEEFGLEAVRLSPAHSLSGGERRRLEIARALACEPRLMLLDEPLTGIDPKTVSEVRSFVRRLRGMGIGILITDHNVRDALAICDRAYIVSGGELIASGAPSEIVSSEAARSAYFGDDFAIGLDRPAGIAPAPASAGKGD